MSAAKATASSQRRSGASYAVGFVVTFLIDGATRAGYRPSYHSVSARALGWRGWIQTANFLVCGALITASSIGILDADASRYLAAAIAAFGPGLVASDIFPMDPMRGYPPGTPDRSSTRACDLRVGG